MAPAQRARPQTHIKTRHHKDTIMTNYHTNFAFKIAATWHDAERLIEVIRCAADLDNGEQLQLGRDIVDAFREERKRPEDVFMAIVDDRSVGFECLFSEEDQSLIIFDTDGSPNLWALATCLQRLFPKKLPLGFVYSDTCDKSRPDGFGGGYFTIKHEGVGNSTLSQILDHVLTAAAEADDD
jgi:hypothetical protein